MSKSHEYLRGIDDLEIPELSTDLKKHVFGSEDIDMFCFQCQETCDNSGCTEYGKCGKSPAVALLQDKLIQSLKNLSLVLEVQSITHEIGILFIQSLFMTITNANFDEIALQNQIHQINHICESYKSEIKIAPFGVLSEKNEDLRSLKELITYGLKGISAYLDHAMLLGHQDLSLYEGIIGTLRTISKECEINELINLSLAVGSMAVKAMELLDLANTSTYGHPVISKVNIGVGHRPGILVSGHDLRDLQELLEQSKDSGIDIYTHGEMLPAHYYPELKKYPHLFGNYGNAWYQQETEFSKFNGPILMTTNCLIPLRSSSSYKNRIFTTGIVGGKGIPHIEERLNNQPKDFSQIIALSQTCPPPTEIERGEIIGGFAHNQVISLADQIVDAVKSGLIKKFIVMAGCDGRHQERSYFSDVALNLPKDTIILTAGCAKYKYNKLDLGKIGDIPRLLDAGQCSDSYSLALIALKLKDAFGLSDVNDLPLAFDIAWYEQKAVAVLLGLLSLGFKHIRLGPTLPAFLSEGVVKVLVENFGIMGTTTVNEDIEKMMNDK